MNKQQLIDELAARTGQTKTACKAILEAFTDTVGNKLAKGENLILVGFGTFSVVATKARTGRNPRTGEPLTIKPKRKVKFKAGNELAEKVN